MATKTKKQTPVKQAQTKVVDPDAELSIEWDDVETLKKEKSAPTTKDSTMTDSEPSFFVDVNKKPLGMPVSGRNWKDRTVKKSSAKFVKPPSMHPSWDQKLEEKKRMDAVKMKDRELKQRKEEQKQQRRKHLDEKRKREAENELKGATAQKITKTETIKRMMKSKTQRKLLKKTA